MYSRQEASKLKQDFWTRFGQYMKPVPSAAGEKVNWSNYKTGVPHIYFRLSAERDGASISIHLAHPDPVQRASQYAQLLALKNVLHEQSGEEWIWTEDFRDENSREISSVHVAVDGLSVLREADWPQLISFLKPRIIALDAFWSDVKPFFEI